MYNQIIITNRTNKNILLKNDKLENKKIYTLDEFKKLYYFDYTEETLFYIMNKYHVKYEISKIYVENIYNIDDKKYNNSKLVFLSSIKEDLINNKLLKVNKLFKNILKNRDIVFYNLPINKELSSLIEKLKVNNTVSINNNESKNYKHTIYEIETIEDEVLYVANNICSLIEKGIKPENIYLCNLNSEYKKLIKKIFPMFIIPVTLKNDDTIFGTFICNKFFENYSSNIEETLDKIKEYVDSKETESIYNKIIDCINNYTFEDDKNKVKEMIKSNLRNIKLDTNDIQSSIHEASFTEQDFTDDNYVFLLSLNQGIIPVIHKDEDYLTDNDKAELDISYTVDKNNLEKDIIKNKIENIKNLIITYKKNANGEDFNISNINEVLNYDIEKITDYKKINSNLYNKIKLTSLLDEYNKYGTKSDLLFELNNHYNTLEYKNYNHIFTGINDLSLKEYLNNKITLSYSSLDKYYRCPFSFYIGNILKLNIYEETFYQLIGTLFHSILEKFLSSSLSYDELWNQELNNLNHEFTIKENFFLNKLKEELSFILDVIKDQENFTTLHDELHEERVYTSISGEMQITFTGIIDKIKYKHTNDSTIIAIIDYKTGNPNLDLTTIKYGIGMQLPIYLYLAKNSKRLNNVKVAGFYLQKVLNNEVSVDNSHSYEQLKRKNLLLQGYSNEDLDILSEFDTSYMDSNIIKGMKVKTDMSFYSYTKVLSSKHMDKIENIAEEKIIEGADLISKGKFEIAPKKIGKTNYGCTLCKFKDICFHTNDDIVELEELKLDDILEIEKEGDENGLD